MHSIQHILFSLEHNRRSALDVARGCCLMLSGLNECTAYSTFNCGYIVSDVVIECFAFLHS